MKLATPFALAAVLTVAALVLSACGHGHGMY